MKKIQLILLFWFNCFSVINAIAETEPNNTVGTANVFAPNSIDNGSIATPGDIDWYQILIPKDGMLTVSIQNTNALCVSIQLYDNNGTIGLVNTTHCNGGFANASFDGLAKGTYYVSVYAYYSGQTPTYSIKNTFSAATPVNDLEPNGTRQLARGLQLNSTKTGHVGFLYNNVRDTADWYKITTTAEGRLRLSIASQNNNGLKSCITLQLFDNDGTTQLANTSECGGSGYASLSVDGLAVGTYYALVTSYYNSQFETYTLSDSLFIPAASNDTEPNNSFATALTLPINSETSGHVGYYYNKQRDTTDWYKIVTNADGLLKIGFVSNNSVGVQTCATIRLFDSDGTTELGNLTNCGGGQSFLSTDGLAAGTYYVQVISYYNSQFETYTLNDTLLVPATANDTEPNATTAEAIILLPNGSAQGHIGYYNNGQRDLIDFYKITTNDDGALQIMLQSNNSVGGQTCSVIRLLDGDGVTELANINNCGGAFSTLTKDGLAAGTYYVAVTSYYGNQFQTYTINSSLVTYNPNDSASNNNPYQATTLPSNTTANGHVGFYYYGNTDAVDWWKVNYTGNGNLSFSFSSIGTLTTTSCAVFELYKDTSAAPIGNVTNCGGAPTTINLAGQTQGYYYIKVRSFYGGQFEAYTINTSFIQTTIAAIRIVSVSSPANCTNTNNQISLRCSGSQPPYTVQLYRFGVAYGSPIMANSTTNIQFANLPQGVYKATVYGDGATGASFGSTPNIGIIPKPKNFDVTNITTTTARAAWSDVPCAKYYKVQYRDINAVTLTTKNTKGNVDTINLSGLMPNTTYIAHVAAADSANATIGISKYSVWDTFTTAPTFMARNFNSAVDEISIISEESKLSVYPNPARNIITIKYEAKKDEKLVNLSLMDMTGRVIWIINKQAASSLNNMQRNVSELKPGVYLLNISKAETGAILQTTKVVVQK